MVGIIVGGILGGRLVKNRTDCGHTFARMIAIEAVVLAGAAVGAALLPLGVDTVGHYLTRSRLSLAMGVQFFATTYLNVADLTLAALTGVVHVVP